MLVVGPVNGWAKHGPLAEGQRLSSSEDGVAMRDELAGVADARFWLALALGYEPFSIQPVTSIMQVISHAAHLVV